MNADDRLNQLEPVIAEAITILDRHTSQLKQLQVATSQILTVIMQHGESITFLLHEQVKMKEDIAEIKGDVVRMDGKLDQILQLLQKPGQ